MRVTVCFKVMADCDRLSDEDWVWDEGLVVDTGFVRKVFNYFDESALETALRLGEAGHPSGGGTRLTALTVDESHADLFLRHLVSVGYPHAVRIQPPEGVNMRFSPRITASLIAAYAKERNEQVLILGQQGGEGGSAQTGFLTAERLGWPCIREVVQVDGTGNEDCLRVISRSVDGVSITQTVRLPVVLVMGHAADTPCLRIPTLKQKLKGKKKPLTLIRPHELGMDPETLKSGDNRLIRLERPQKKGAADMISPASPEQMARDLYDRYLGQSGAL